MTSKPARIQIGVRMSESEVAVLHKLQAGRLLAGRPYRETTKGCVISDALRALAALEEDDQCES